jgi:hypothetical protein
LTLEKQLLDLQTQQGVCKRMIIEHETQHVACVDLENKVKKAQSQMMTHAEFNELWKGADRFAQYVLGLNLHAQNMMMVDTIKDVQRRTQVLIEELTKSGNPELIIVVAPLKRLVG